MVPRLSTGLELEFLGTSSAQSTSTRNVSSLALHFQVVAEGGTLLFDCGEGTSRQFIKSHVRPGLISGVFITHLHGDHIYGLPGLGMRTAGLRDSPSRIAVVAPRGLYRILGMTIFHNTQFALHEVQAPHHREYSADPMAERIGRIHFDHETRSYRVFENDLLTIEAAPIRHSVFCLGYVVQEKDVRGRFKVDKLAADFGLKPGPWIKELERHPFVELPNGQRARSADYMEPRRRGRKIVVLGDTCDPSGVAHLAMDADVLVHEATNSDDERTIALQHSHSTAGMAGEFARKIRAKNLVLTHFSPRNFNSSECTSGWLSLSARA